MANLRLKSMLPSSQCPILSYRSKSIPLPRKLHLIGFALIELSGMKKDKIKSSTALCTRRFNMEEKGGWKEEKDCFLVPVTSFVALCQQRSRMGFPDPLAN